MSNADDTRGGPFSASQMRPKSTAPRAPISIDLNSQSESDAITELFLGEGSAVPASQPCLPKANKLAEPHTAWKVVGREDDMEAEEETGDCAAPSPSLPPFETISPANPPTDSPMIEAVVQGHLPIFAAAWVTQYARARAEEVRSAVILVRVRQGSASVECVFPSGTPAISMTPSESISAALSLAAGMGAKYWIIQTDEVSEPDLWKINNVNRITILTGADEAALVACYRALKGIAQTIRQDTEAEIHVAVLGATPEKAAHAIDRVSRAGNNFLGRRISGSLAAAKIGAGTASVLYRSQSDNPTLEEVVEAISSIPRPAPKVSSPTSRQQAVQSEMAALRALNRQTSDPEEQVDGHESQLPEEQASTHQGREHSEDELSPPVPISRPASLVQMINDIDAIGITCPLASGVEFGIAPDGRLHLVAHVDGELNSGHPSNQSRAVEDLMVAAAWATSHARLLLSAHAAVRLDEHEHSPILHVVTTRPRDARRLLDTHIRVHLVLPPQEEQAWISMELN